jgi:hypothetical protein
MEGFPFHYLQWNQPNPNKSGNKFDMEMKSCLRTRSLTWIPINSVARTLVFAKEPSWNPSLRLHHCRAYWSRPRSPWPDIELDEVTPTPFWPLLQPENHPGAPPPNAFKHQRGASSPAWASVSPRWTSLRSLHCSRRATLTYEKAERCHEPKATPLPLCFSRA